LKTLPAHRMKNPKAVSRFQREMRAIGKLDHPNIVRALDAGEADGQPFLVMELMEGVNLSSLIRQSGTLSIPDACEVIRQAAIGLQYILIKVSFIEMPPSRGLLSSCGCRCGRYYKRVG
ncbi:protein kinase, partial [Planctomycetaceae bacterium]|nr:protein kinase [Planctomycetaceae bacterium]